METRSSKLSKQKIITQHETDTGTDPIQDKKMSQGHMSNNIIATESAEANYQPSKQRELRQRGKP